MPYARWSFNKQCQQLESHQPLPALLQHAKVCLIQTNAQVSVTSFINTYLFKMESPPVDQYIKLIHFNACELISQPDMPLDPSRQHLLRVKSSEWNLYRNCNMLKGTSGPWHNTQTHTHTKWINVVSRSVIVTSFKARSQNYFGRPCSLDRGHYITNPNNALLWGKSFKMTIHFAVFDPIPKWDKMGNSTTHAWTAFFVFFWVGTWVPITDPPAALSRWGRIRFHPLMDHRWRNGCQVRV